MDDLLDHAVERSALRAFAHVGCGDASTFLTDEACVSFWHERIIMQGMNEFYRAKFSILFDEFTRYLITQPDFGEDIPKGVQLILLE
jgi:hypothetical protein